VVVLGGGPAGCAAAVLLARRAHEVALVVPSHPPAPTLGESVPPSARRLLEELGLVGAIDAAGFVANEGNTVWWAGGEPRVETFPTGEAGFHAERASLEAVLVDAAESVGVRVYRATTARAAEESEDGWSILCEVGDGPPLALSAPWALDATGRHGLLARREGREPDRETTTLALVQTWRVGRAETHTLVESYEDGWAWSIPVGPDARCVTAMVDQRHAELAGSDVSGMLAAQLARTEHLRHSLAGGEPTGPAWACPASLHTATRFGRPGLLLVGDAGSAIDPLSSYGVKKALSSGWMAGIVAHTALVDPPMAGAAIDFFDEREREVYRESRRASVDFFEDAARAYGHDFWRSRARAARAASAAASPLAQGADRGTGTGHMAKGSTEGVPESAVRAAFDLIRERDRLDAVPGPTLRTFPKAAIRGQRIVMEEHLGSAAYPAGMRWVRGVDLGRLVEIAPRHADVPAGWSAYNAAAPPVTLPDYLTALSTAFAAGLLAHQDA
jgi:flavin-dependent dehydrogenase